MVAGPGVGPGAGGGSRRVGVPVALGISGVVVAALVGGVVWLAPWAAGQAGSAHFAMDSPAPSAEVTNPPTTAKSPPRKSSTPKPPRKTTRTKTPKATSSPPPADSSTPKPTTARPTPSPTRTTKKPVTSAKISILEIQLSGGPGQSAADGCYMPPLHFQTSIESSKSEIWISYVWEIDGKAVSRNRSWVPENEYQAFAPAGQYMPKAGSHKITLRVTSPSVTSKSVSIDVCALETY